MFFYYDFNKVLYNSIYNTLSIDYNMFLYKNKNGSGYMEKKVNLEQKIIDLKLKKRELVLAGKNTSDVDEEIKKIKQEDGYVIYRGRFRNIRSKTAVDGWRR